MTADAVGGVWQYALDLTRELKTLDWEVTLVTMGPEPDADQRRAADAIPNLELRVSNLPLDWLEAGPAPVARAAEHVARIAQQASCDLVQLNMPTLAANGAFTEPVVAVTHGCVSTWWSGARNDPLAPQYHWHRRMMQQGLSRADAVVAPSASYAAMVADHYQLRQAPSVVRNGRDPACRPAPAAQQDYVLTAGRLWDRAKNIDTLDRVGGRLAVPFHAAGALTGPNGERPRIENLHLLGHLPADALARWRAPRPIFVSAARFEPFGLAVLEAAQAGCALILSDIPTFRELWDGAAIFVEPEDTETFQYMIETLIGDPPVRHALGEAAAARAGQYRPLSTARAMGALFDRLLDDRARRAAA